MEAYGIFDDFLSCEDLDANNSLPTGKATWEFLEATIGTLAQADEVGGAIIFASPATINQGGQIIMGSNAGGSAFKPAAGKHLWFEARAKVVIGSAAKFNYFIGLVEPEAVDILVNGGAVPTNDEIIGFIVLDTESNWSFMGSKSDAQDINPLGAGSVVDTSYHYFGFYVNGVTDVTCYYDRVEVAAGALATANIPILGIMPAFAVKAGDGNIESMTIDYLMCVQLR